MKLIWSIFVSYRHTAVLQIDLPGCKLVHFVFCFIRSCLTTSNTSSPDNVWCFKTKHHVKLPLIQQNDQTILEKRWLCFHFLYKKIIELLSCEKLTDKYVTKKKKKNIIELCQEKKVIFSNLIYLYVFLNMQFMKRPPNI